MYSSLDFPLRFYYLCDSCLLELQFRFDAQCSHSIMVHSRTFQLVLVRFVYALTHCQLMGRRDKYPC